MQSTTPAVGCFLAKGILSLLCFGREEKAKAAAKAKTKKVKRGLVIGLATVVGGTVIGMSRVNDDYFIYQV